MTPIDLCDHARRNHVAIELAGGNITPRGVPYFRQCGNEIEEACGLAILTHDGSVRMVAIFQAPSIILADGLDIGPLVPGYPDLGIGRRDWERMDAGQDIGISDSMAFFVNISIISTPDAGA
jgi:hypothetical protein